MNIYSIKDIKAKLFGQPFFSRNDASATRSIAVYLGKPNDGDPMAKYPEDFVLYRLGKFDDETGAIIPEETPVSLVALQTLSKNPLDK